MENVRVVAWQSVKAHLTTEAARLWRLAAKSATDFERGKYVGAAEFAEKLLNLPETLAILEEEDERVLERQQG